LGRYHIFPNRKNVFVKYIIKLRKLFSIIIMKSLKGLLS